MAGTKVGVAMLCAMLCGIVAHAQEFCADSIPVKGAPRPMPSRGYITCCNSDIMLKTAEGKTRVMVETLTAYLRRGGRFIDTAEAYQMEPYVGQAVRASGVPRSEIWISSKVDVFAWSPDFGDPFSWVLWCVDQSLQAFGFDYIDVMSLHAGPMQLELQVGINVTTKVFLALWRGLVEAKRLGKILYLGTCEMTQAEIEQLMQIEPPQVALGWWNPWMPDGQFEYLKWLKDAGIAVVVYGMFNFKAIPLLVNRKLQATQKAAERHGVTYGQFLLQWILQEGYAFITPMYHFEYLAENAPCFNFTVTRDDMAIVQEQTKWPCKFNENCLVQYLPGCFPPGSEEYHHTWTKADYFTCAVYAPLVLSEELPCARFHIFGQELIVDVPMVIFMLLASATAIWHIRKRRVAAEEGLGVALLE